MCDRHNKEKYHDINPYTDILLDCYQNMVLSLLTAYECDVWLLGGLWPWKFGYSIENIPLMTNCKMTTAKRIKEIYNLDVVEVVLPTSEDAIEVISDYAKRTSVIININQFYVPHHYPHIYNKINGPHSLIITQVNLESGYSVCIDSIPCYKGKIDNKNIIDGVNSFPKEIYGYRKISYISNENCTFSKEKSFQKSFSLFTKDIYNVVNNMFDEKTINISDIICILLEKMIELNETSLREWLLIFCSGTWGWEIDRNGKLFYHYIELNKDMFVEENGYLTVCSAINTINRCLNAAFKLLYKGTMKTTKEMMQKAIDKLKESIVHENIILDKLMTVRKINNIKLIQK